MKKKITLCAIALCMAMNAYGMNECWCNKGDGITQRKPIQDLETCIYWCCINKQGKGFDFAGIADACSNNRHFPSEINIIADDLKRKHKKEKQVESSQDSKYSSDESQQDLNGDIFGVNKQSVPIKMQFSILGRQFIKPLAYKSRLLIGEAGFFYALATLSKHNKQYPGFAKAVIATEYQPEDELEKKYENFLNNVKKCREMGATVMFQVDGTRLENQFLGRRFKRIHFNFPMSINTNYKSGEPKKLVQQFFQSAAKMQKYGDRIHIALPGGEERWRETTIYNLYQNAAAAGYKQIPARKFNKKRYPEYEHCQNVHTSCSLKSTTQEGIENGIEHIFEKVRDDDEKQYKQLDPISESSSYEDQEEYSAFKKFEQFMLSSSEAHKQLASGDIEVEEKDFLNDVAKEYKESMKNPDGSAFGGDLEIGAVSIEYDVEIRIYGPGRTDNPQVVNKGAKKGVINLWFENGHYENYDPTENVVTSVPKDGNCLFHAIIRALKTLRILEGEPTVSSHDEVKQLRKKVVSNIKDDMIVERFRAVINANNYEELNDAIEVLPKCDALYKAINLFKALK